ncbi:DNA alkylation repair protein [Candidatus Acetothermia bacterium]|jgi:3-methyladenine DNA glycosylase AlkC|nr:DNA alkylation repair protein [Candidatus Acetothermia bacterium]MCI2426959.1 DNA alkylation repair protein [Candidatus Acetothermia bacterium]MCI2428519.1 DNA alkylation repair protein [Candidatus Acetothermia bacterium]
MKENIARLLAYGEIDLLVELLEKEGKMTDMRYAIKKILAAEQNSEAIITLAEKFAMRKELSARHIACDLVSRDSVTNIDRSMEILLKMADDKNWQVRESAGTACGRILRREFPGTLVILHRWRSHPSANVRRAVLIATMKAAQTKNPDWGEPLLKLIDPLMVDRNLYVRRNLGPFTLGSGMLRYYPEVTFEFLTGWSTSHDEQALWNVAMAFSASAAPALVNRALIILRKLALDERRYVWRAVATAMWKLGKKKPELIRNELQQWLKDERRATVARKALKYL